MTLIKIIDLRGLKRREFSRSIRISPGKFPIPLIPYTLYPYTPLPLIIHEKMNVSVGSRAAEFAVTFIDRTAKAFF